MHCPHCHSTYVEGVTRCPTCDVDLVASPAAEDVAPADDLELVTVLETSDPGLLPVVHSLLEAEQIPVVVQNDFVQDAVGLGRATGQNQATGRARVLVPAVLADAARELIADHATELAADAEPPATGD